jgi:hypothetical protein
VPWFKVDDHLATHAKVVKAGNPAMGLWVRAGSWAAQHLTNGHVPTHVVTMLGTTAQARLLVQAGLWLEDEGGWRFHDWFGYQPTAEEAEVTREKRREAGRKGGIKSGQTRRGGKQT